MVDCSLRSRKQLGDRHAGQNTFPSLNGLEEAHHLSDWMIFREMFKVRSFNQPAILSLDPSPNLQGHGMQTISSSRPALCQIFHPIIEMDSVRQMTCSITWNLFCRQHLSPIQNESTYVMNSS